MPVWLEPFLPLFRGRAVPRDRWRAEDEPDPSVGSFEAVTDGDGSHGNGPGALVIPLWLYAGLSRREHPQVT